MADSYNLTVKNVSYLRARDPSILASNGPKLSRVKTNLRPEFGEVTQEEEEESENLGENIRVYLRIKKGYNFHDLYKIDGNTLTSIVPPGSNFLRNVKECDSLKKIYTFTEIFEPQTTQKDIFNHIVKPKILDFINGQNSTLMTYGASGSGKTFTVIGTDEDPGVVPRSLEYLFRTLPQLSKNPVAKPLPTGELILLNEQDCKKEKLACRSLLHAFTLMDKTQHIQTYTTMQQRLSSEPAAQLENHPKIAVGVWVSFAEIYNEQIFDLLQLDPPRGQPRPKLRLGMTQDHTYIKNLTNVSVTSGQQAYQILQYGIHNLNCAPTLLNKHSSRSHSIFTIKLVQVCEEHCGSCISCFNFCDLAGSERSKKTQNVGDRLKESNNINNSLLVLGKCISAVRNLQKQNDQKLVPFRESKLTQLFQKALAGAEDIAMIVNVSPSREMFDESQHVLNFSAVAKDIALERKPEMKKQNRFSELVEGKRDIQDLSKDDYKKAFLLLQYELETQRNEYEVNQQINLDYVRQEYDKLLITVQKDSDKIIERTSNSLKAQYESKLERLKLRYERRIRELEEDNVIEISSSDEESEKECQCKKHVAELQNTLAEGVADFKELKRKNEGLNVEIVKLKDKISFLESQLDYYRPQMESESSFNEAEWEL